MNETAAKGFDFAGAAGGVDVGKAAGAPKEKEGVDAALVEGAETEGALMIRCRSALYLVAIVNR